MPEYHGQPVCWPAPGVETSGIVGGEGKWKRITKKEGGRAASSVLIIK